MTLEEAIKHCEEVAEELGMKADFETDNQTYAMSESERTEFKECAKDHRQLAEWLMELKKRREQDVPDTNVGDTISRQAAIDTIGKIFPADPMKNDYTQGITCGAALATEYIRQLPSAQPEPQWIPVTERLPKRGQKCLVSDKGCIAIDIFWGRGGAYNWQFYVRDYEAWMPLVEPYKEEGE